MDDTREARRQARTERLSRALVRLYPCDWRARYGDELVALIAHSGLTWRSAADIVRAAVGERMHRLVRLARAEAAVTVPLPPLRPWTDREFLLIRAGLIPLICLTAGALHAIGVPYPHWGVWLPLASQPVLHFDEESRITDATMGERIVLAYAWFLLALLVAAAGIAVGVAIRQLGAPEPPLSVFVAVPALMLAGAVRLLYRRVRSTLKKPRPEVTAREIAAWTAALFGSIAVAGAADLGRMVFWTMSFVCFVWMRHAWVYRLRAARWRAVREQRGF